MLTVEAQSSFCGSHGVVPYVAGLAALADDEADLGVGNRRYGRRNHVFGGFSGGKFVHADGFALGGNHVTMDLARGLNTGVADAERDQSDLWQCFSGWIG